MPDSAFPTMAGTMPTVVPPAFLEALIETQAVRPIVGSLHQRNTALDHLFYDIGALTEEELTTLSRETNREGSILVVYPAARGGSINYKKYHEYKVLRAAPGSLLRHFCIAGVGSSDVGAAALARNLANVVDEPVGAIIGGYGVADLMTEALGGWFVLGQANRWMRMWKDFTPRAANQDTRADRNRADQMLSGTPDARALLSLLRDEDREIATLLGHSKGCLSIAFTLEALMLDGDTSAIAKARKARIVTTGAVVDLPDGFKNVVQLLGGIDWFGGMNSRIGIDHRPVPNAWHHLNTRIPAHLPLEDTLREIL